MIKKIGDRLVLVGVAHVLPESKEEVKESIIREKPEVVGVELCQDRYIELTTRSQRNDEVRLEFSREAILAKIIRFIQEKIGERTGMLPGDEMLAAIQEAQSVEADVELIDRDIRVTLNRLINEMGFLEKIKILGGLLVSPFQFGGGVKLEDLTKEEVVEKLIYSLKDFSNTTYQVLIEERNKYMVDRIFEMLRSRTGKVLCVVGAGHIPGLTEELEPLVERGILDPWINYHMEWNVE